MGIGDLLGAIETGGPIPQREIQQRPEAPKRKAEEDLQGLSGKHQKTAQPKANTSRPIAQVKGVANGSKMNSSGVKVGKSNGATYGAAALPQPVVNKPPPEPKPGTHAWILLQAKRSQEKYSKAGTLQHKKTDAGCGSSGRAERSAGGHTWAKHKAPASKEKTAVLPNSKTGPYTARPAPKVAEPVKKVKKAATVTTGYTGTARPKTSLVKTAPRTNAKPAAASRRESAPEYRTKKLAPAHSRRLTSYEDEEDEDDEGDYYSGNESSDMEADAFDVEEEERLALKAAQQEDAREAKRLADEAAEKARRKAAIQARR